MQAAKQQLQQVATSGGAVASVSGRAVASGASVSAKDQKVWKQFSDEQKKDLMASWMGGSMTVFNAIFKNEMKLESTLPLQAPIALLTHVANPCMLSIASAAR